VAQLLLLSHSWVYTFTIVIKGGVGGAEMCRGGGVR
jgi:hypothetical protein